MSIGAALAFGAVVGLAIGIVVSVTTDVPLAPQTGLLSRTIRSMEGRDLAVSLAGGRIAIGVVSLLAPGFVGRTITGRDGSEGGTRLFARMVGARDLGLGLGLLVALNRGAPVRGWLEASAVVDGIDATACLLARGHIRPSVFPGALGLATAGALLSAWLARQLDPARSPLSAARR
jgi:hypothetical protein